MHTRKIPKEDVTLLQLKGRWKTLKKLYKLYSTLSNKSGWSWDYDNHRPTPGDESVWDDVIKLNKEFKVCQDKPFPLFFKIHDLVTSSTATGEYATNTSGGVQGGNLYVDVEESTTDSSEKGVQEVEKDTVQAQQKNKKVCDSVGSKRTKSHNPSPTVSKRRSAETNMEMLDKLVTLTDRRSKITERRCDETDMFSFDACMDKLLSMPGIGGEEACAVVDALKILENRIFFIRIPQDIMEYWLSKRVEEFRSQG